jgi:hypothetical protein
MSAIVATFAAAPTTSVDGFAPGLRASIPAALLCLALALCAYGSASGGAAFAWAAVLIAPFAVGSAAFAWYERSMEGRRLEVADHAAQFVGATSMMLAVLAIEAGALTVAVNVLGAFAA